MSIENPNSQSNNSTIMADNSTVSDSSTNIDSSTVKSVADLARLSIDSTEIETTTEKFTAILALINEMQEVNTDNTVPLAHPLDHNQRLRPDVITETNQREQLLAGAPATAEGLFLVPRVIE